MSRHFQSEPARRRRRSADRLVGASADWFHSPLTRSYGAVSPLAPGAIVGPYQVVGSLGHGGMGSVYRALDTRLDRAVAAHARPCARIGTIRSAVRTAGRTCGHAPRRGGARLSGEPGRSTAERSAISTGRAGAIGQPGLASRPTRRATRPAQRVRRTDCGTAPRSAPSARAARGACRSRRSGHAPSSESRRRCESSTDGAR